VAEREHEQQVRTERILPGVWRIRLPLPWPGVPHVNAFALAGQGGVVLFDTGMDLPGGFRQLESGLAQAGFPLGDVKLLVCTHAHTDHYGLAGPIVDAAGCELWMHPAYGHIRAMVEDPDAALDRRLEVARQSGVPEKALERYESSRRGTGPGIARLVEPDRELLPGVQVETDLGLWDVYETPGHAPSHVTLHQPGRRLMISGDHLLGRISIFFDYGHTPDPVGEFLGGMDAIEGLDTGLCLAGHGKPFREIPAKIEANRKLVGEQLGRVREALTGEPRTAFELIPAVLDTEEISAMGGVWGLQMALAYIDHLVLAGEAVEAEGGETRRWQIPA
jgi:glyoxylase-like metal-dependent hydrolase (beta-lactamase superfamily II)